MPGIAIWSGTYRNQEIHGFILLRKADKGNCHVLWFSCHLMKHFHFTELRAKKDPDLSKITWAVSGATGIKILVDQHQNQPGLFEP